MAQAITYTGYPQVGGRGCATGKITGATGDAINVITGFKPSKVTIHIDGGTDAGYEWLDSMGEEEAVKTLFSTGVKSYVGSAVITTYAGSTSTNAQGFTIAAAVITAADTIYFEAWP